MATPGIIGQSTTYNNGVASGTGSTYRSYLQSLVGGGNLNAQEANALLQVAGDDGKLNTAFLNDPYAYTKSDSGHIAVPTYNDPNTPFGYGPQGLSRLNDLYYGAFSSKNSAPTLQVGAGGGGDAGVSQAQLGQLDDQQNIGLQNIANSFNSSANRLDENKAVAKRNYETAGQQNTQNYSNTRTGAINNTRATNNALQRLLGINGSGNSSAAYEQAPYAAGLQGSQALQQAQQTYGLNQGSLDTNWEDTQRGYRNAFDDLNTQKYQQENGLKASIAQTRAQLLGATGQSGAIPSLLAQITQLGQQYANPVMRTPDISFAAPNVNNYNLSRPGAPVTQGGAASDINPTFLGLLAGQRDQYGNLIQQ